MLPFLFSSEIPRQRAATWPDSYFLLCCGAGGLQGAAGSSICSSAASPAPGKAAGPLPGLLSCLSQKQSQLSQTLSRQHLIIPKKAWVSHWELGPRHPPWAPELCSLPQTKLRLSPHGGWADGLSTWGAGCEWVIFLQFSLGGPSCFGDHLMDLPMGGLMCGVFHNAFISAVYLLFPKASPTGQAPHWLPGDGEPSSGRGLFSPGWMWDRTNWCGAGVWIVPDCPHPLAASPVPHPGCPGCLSPGQTRRVMPFPSQSPLQLLAFLPADVSIPSCPSPVCRPCSRSG